MGGSFLFDIFSVRAIVFCHHPGIYNGLKLIPYLLHHYGARPGLTDLLIIHAQLTSASD